MQANEEKWDDIRKQAVEATRSITGHAQPGVAALAALLLVQTKAICEIGYALDFIAINTSNIEDR